MPPRWLMIVGSVVIGFHLLAIGFRVLGAPSGPWPAPPPDGPMPMGPPVFAFTVDNWTGPYYLSAIKLAHDYHFMTNRTGGREIYLEARLTDRDGKQVTIKLPEDGANFWVRHRQSLLAAAFGEDMPYIPQGAPKVVKIGEKAPSALVWVRPDGETKETLDDVKEQDLSRVRPTMRPNSLTLLLANAYARYLCRQYGATSVQLVRYYQERIPPDVMNPQMQPMQEFFTKQSSDFRELPR
jgi:hypothetical protein